MSGRTLTAAVGVVAGERWLNGAGRITCWRVQSRGPCASSLDIASPRVSLCLLTCSLTNNRQSRFRYANSSICCLREVAVVQNHVLIVRIAPRVSIWSSRSSLLRCPRKQRSSARRLPYSFPTLVFRKECLPQTLFQGLVGRNMPLPSLFQDLVECCSWIYCGQSPSGTRTAKSSRGNELRNLTLSIHLVQFCAESSKLLFKPTNRASRRCWSC